MIPAGADRYVLIPLQTCIEFFRYQAAMERAGSPESFLSDDAEGRLLNKVLTENYRWIRTDGDWAIWEKP